MAKPANLAEALDVLSGASHDSTVAQTALLGEKDYAKAMKAWKVAHEAALKLKDATNGVYKHLSELKPKKADKLKPGGKLDNAPEGKQVDKKADKRRTERAEKGSKKDRRAAETERTEAASDEPADDHDDP